MSSSSRNDQDSDSLSEPRQPFRHTPFQTQKLEEYFVECQRPCEMQRKQLAEEIELTDNQVKIWFQNKRNIVKGKDELSLGFALRCENERLQKELDSIKEMLNNELPCVTCKGLLNVGFDELHGNIEQLPNALLSQGASLSNIVAGIPKNQIRMEPLLSNSSPLNGSTRNMIIEKDNNTSFQEVQPNHHYNGTNHDHVSILSNASYMVDYSNHLFNESTRNMINGNGNHTSLLEVQHNHQYHETNHDHVEIPSSAPHIVDFSASRDVYPSFTGMMNLGVDIEIPNLTEIMVSAKNEVVSLLQKNEPLWIEDITDGRYVIHRETYDKTFSNNSRKKGGSSPRTMFESSKDMGYVSINANKLITMLSDSKVRLDIFPTILTESVVVQEYAGKTISPNQLGPIQLVYEQMHLNSPLLAPRCFYYIRYCEKIDVKTWVIVEVSCDQFSYENMQLPGCGTPAWRLPSGCLIKEATPSLSKVTWLEHVQVDNLKALTPQLYRDIVLRGLSFDANRFLQTLLRSVFRLNCHIMVNKIGVTQHFGEILSMTPEARRVIIDISYRMLKNFCGNLTMKNKIDLPHMYNNNIRFSIYNVNGSTRQSSRFLVNATTSMWIPLPYNEIVDFLNNADMRNQWDVLCDQKPAKQIGIITYGKSQENSISLIQPFVSLNPNLMVIQETLSDPLGAVVLYTLTDIYEIQKAIHQAIPQGSSLPQPPPCDIEVIPSGFIIYKDGSPGSRIATSKKSYTYSGKDKGSLVTAVFQVVSQNTASLETAEMSIVRTLHSVVTSTVQNIMHALNCHRR